MITEGVKRGIPVVVGTAGGSGGGSPSAVVPADRGGDCPGTGSLL